MTTTTTTTTDGAVQAGPTDRLLTAGLLFGPLLSLAADTTYAVRGWDDPTAGVLHVLGAVGYGLVVLRVAAWLPVGSRLGAALVGVGLLGLAGDAAYGFEAIHASLGDVPLVDQPGAAGLIKPLGLCFPLALLLVAAALSRLGRRGPALLVLVGSLAWPVAHIADLGVLAVGSNALLVVAFGVLLRDAGPSR